MENQNRKLDSCLNCEQKYSGNFCPNCGQRANIQVLSVKEVFAEIPRTILFLESRFKRIIKDFLKSPIDTILDYSRGKRKKYGSPIKYFYFFASLELILQSIYNQLVHPDEIDNLELESDTGIFSRFENAMNLADNFSDTIYVSLTIPIFLGIVLAWYFRKYLSLAESIAYAFVYYSMVELYWILENLSNFSSHFFDLAFIPSLYGLPEAIFLGFLFNRSFKGIRFLQFLKGFFAFYLSVLLILFTALIYITISVYLQ